jgi:hypothetical protein
MSSFASVFPAALHQSLSSNTTWAERCELPSPASRQRVGTRRSQRRMRVQALSAAPLGLTAAVATAAAAASLGVAMARGSKELRPTAEGQSTPWNSAILSLCPSLTAPYRMPAWMPRGGHTETILAAWFRCAAAMKPTPRPSFTSVEATSAAGRAAARVVWLATCAQSALCASCAS